MAGNIEEDNTEHGVGHKVEVALLYAALGELHMDMVGHQEAALEVYMMALGMFVVDVIGVLVEIDWALVAELMFPYDSNQVGLVEVDYIDWDTVLVADLPVEVELEAGRIG